MIYFGCLKQNCVDPAFTEMCLSVIHLAALVSISGYCAVPSQVSRDCDVPLTPERVPGAPVPLSAAQARDDAERAAVVAADADRHPRAVRRLAAGWLDR